MRNLLAIWSNLGARRQVTVAVATVSMFLAVVLLARIAAQPDYQLLYSGLPADAAGEVIQSLDAKGVPFRVQGGAIYVDGAARDALRLSLAGEGLPRNDTAGYELLDNLTGFSTTSQMFSVAYWRAKEGELARTIAAGPNVRAARVHIANGTTSRFGDRTQVTASVFVIPQNGRIAPEQGTAIRHLVASAVAGLGAANVSVVDGSTGAMLGMDDMAQTTGRREAVLKQNVERLLTARLGPGRAVVEVSVETERQSESITERRFDPDSRVAISSEIEERSTDSRDQGGQAVSVSSNLGEAAPDQSRSTSSNNSETRERTNYEVSETQRQITREPGAISRLTVAVLVDGLRQVGADGQPTWRPLPEEELDDLRLLVASAVGLNEGRGDVLTLKSMEFQPPVPIEPLPAAGLADRLAVHAMTLIQVAALSLVGLVLGLFVLRPLLMTAARGDAVPLLAARPSDTPVLTGEIADRAPLLVAGRDDASADPVQRLRALIDERQTESVQILRDWIEGESEEVR